MWQLVYSYKNYWPDGSSFGTGTEKPKPHCNDTIGGSYRQYGSFYQPNQTPCVVQKRSRRKRNDYNDLQLPLTVSYPLKSAPEHTGTNTYMSTSATNKFPLQQEQQLLSKPLVGPQRSSLFRISEPRISGLSVKIQDITSDDVKTYVLKKSDENEKKFFDKWPEKKDVMRYDMSSAAYNAYIIGNFLTIHPSFDPYRSIRVYGTRTGERRYEIQVEGLQEETFMSMDDAKCRIYDCLYHYYQQQIKLKKEDELFFNPSLKDWLILEGGVSRYTVVIVSIQYNIWSFGETIKNYFKTIENMKDPQCLKCINKYTDKFYSVLQQNGIGDIDLNNIPTRYKGNTKSYFDEEIRKLKQKISESIQSKKFINDSTKRSRENETKYLFKLIGIAAKGRCLCR